MEVYIVTGANAGVGREVARFLAKQLATVYMLCRNKGRAEAAKEEIEAHWGALGVWRGLPSLSARG